MPRIEFRQYRTSDRGWVLSENLRYYRTVERFDRDFDDVATDALDQLEQRIGDEKSNFIIAEADGCRIGCVFFSPEDDISGRIRLFFLAEKYRGRGIGRQMLNLIIERARQNGIKTIRVSTFERHRQACGLYAATGFEGKASEPVEAFGHVMRQVDFEYTC